MPQKLALKRLTASDLTFFEWQFTNHNAGNQKAINLNANIFIDRLYPSVPEIAQEQGERFPLDLYLYGPGLKGEYNLQRKIVKGQTYKNWRLNGEFVYNPSDDPTRFNVLAPEDFAIFSFRGELFPQAASIYFIAAAQPDDSAIHALLAQFIGTGRRSMVDITQQILDQVIQDANPAEQHPLYDLLLEDALEDAAQNGIEGIRRLRTRASRRRISHDTLRRARDSAGRIGRMGEEFVNAYLTRLNENGEIADFRWIADENAISPYDFEIDTNKGLILIDVKATEGDFENPLHISYNELLQMRQSDTYYLYRVYEMIEMRAQLRVSQNMRGFAEQILDILEQLPDGVRPDSISVLPAVLLFDDVQSLELSLDEE